ncbi:MAG: FtsQ-type POTRA domain-containing protein [Clostridia bacterium]|nr:FtsQ-type POTRA domain-containing protein [Clostridia bacterium]
MKQKKKQKIIHSSPGKILRRKFFIVFLMTAASIAITFSFLFFFRVKTVSVLHNKEITTDEILTAADIPLNRHIFAVNAKKAESSVFSLSPYIKSVNITRHFPSKIVIESEEYTADFYIEIEQKYYLISHTLLILEEISESEISETDAAELYLPEINTDPEKFGVGKKIIFLEKEDRASVPLLMDTFSESKLFGSFTKLDLDEEANLTAVVDKQYTIKFGNKKDLEEKLRLCEEAVEYLSENMTSVTGTIHAWTSKKVTFEITGVT